MSWNVCKQPECESYTARPDGDWCESCRRKNAKESEDEKKQLQKKALLIAKQVVKNKVPRDSPNKISAKRHELNKEYFKLVEKFKKDNPKCHARINDYCTDSTDDPHHSKGRGVYLLDVSTWIPVCRSCHIWIGSNHAAAIEKGLIFSRLAKQTEPHKL